MIKDLLFKFEQIIFPKYYYKISHLMSDILVENNLIVADIGAAYGVDPRWRLVESCTRFITFEPDQRSLLETGDGKNINYQVGLSDQTGKKNLFLTNFPAASSLYPINFKVINDFATASWHEVTGSALIEVDTLDNCLADDPDLFPHFIKIDVEGSDLDVLKGASEIIAHGLLGIQIEVSFIERHRSSPLFSEVDRFLRDRGFTLFILAREHWLRHNLVYGINSHPQLVWGDGVYFLGRDRFLALLDQTPLDQRLPLIVKFLVLLIIYGIHDYAIEIIEVLTKSNYLDSELGDDFKQTVISSVVPSFSYLIKSFLLVLFWSIVYIMSWIIPPLKVRSIIYLKKYTVILAMGLLKLSLPNGIYNACISDRF